MINHEQGKEGVKKYKGMGWYIYYQNHVNELQGEEDSNN